MKSGQKRCKIVRQNNIVINCDYILCTTISCSMISVIFSAFQFSLFSICTLAPFSLCVCLVFSPSFIHCFIQTVGSINLLRKHFVSCPFCKLWCIWCSFRYYCRCNTICSSRVRAMPVFIALCLWLISLCKIWILTTVFLLLWLAGCMSVRACVRDMQCVRRVLRKRIVVKKKNQRRIQK